jgi:hypothetical protein
MNFGEIETDVPLNLDNLRVGERYTFYHVNAQNVGIRATLIRIIPGNGNIQDRITFRPDVGAIRSVPLPFIFRITQSGIGPNDDTAKVINSFLGGRKKRKKRKFRKTKRRRRKTKRRRRKTKRCIKRRCRTRRR